MSKSPRALARLAAAGVAVAALVVVPAAGASAHVRVVPESTTAGAWTTLTFRVPNESPTAVTTSVAVDLPTDTPFLGVSTKPVPGWTASVEEGDLPQSVDVDGTTITRAPVRVVWTADDEKAAIGDGEFQELEISVGPLPAAGTTLVLPAEQSYSDGSVVAWDDVATGDDEPEHPAPALVVTEDTTGAGHGAAHGDTEDADGVTTEATTSEQTTSETTSSDGVARALGGVGVLLGGTAVAVAVTGRRRATGGE
ncbi:YcnI family protein [Cellulomonas sp. DKR-3]|uniref:YcnI family protein n=1 Tax=Cellulomonas fulva TaxID=2835530 RepID=A0ABS5U066_9CELL|nr:YcnI family protein [Cellulomonas fulva]MBT0994810.1 YcnI family protein [Cellulomonas fulva]